MKKRFLVAAVLACIAITAFRYIPADTDATILYRNGNWYDGTGFVHGERLIQKGEFVASGHVKPDSIIDLQGKYVIPPFAEAHTHLLEGIGNVDERINNYLTDGVFYVKNPNNVLEWTRTIHSKVNHPQSLDASFANAGITGPGGHPESIYEVNIRAHIKQMGKELEQGWFRNKAYYSVSNQQEVETLWPGILQGKPDFIKIYLSNTGVSPQFLASATKKMRTGLRPDLAALVVRKAHDAGLRVTAHVETADDFREAVRIGVDEINHTPGFYIYSRETISNYRLTEADAKKAAEKKIYVVTALLSRDLLDDPSLLPDVKSLQANNIAVLAKHGVRMAVGSDHANSPVDEINALRELNVFDNATLLKIWCESTPATIFPKRKLGKLKDGCEANFLVLNGNPIDDWKFTRDIAVRIKHGKVLRVK